MPVEIYKGLYVGPGKIPLYDINIDIIISLDCGAKPYGRRDIENICLDIEDFDVEPISRIGEALENIDMSLASGKKVYLHCRAGCGRTGTVAIAYLIGKGYSLDEAYNLFINMRGCGPEDERQMIFLEIFYEAVNKYGFKETVELLKRSKSLEDFIVKLG
ncbi:MAG TPA: hypothetical protein EYH44_03830 [Thermoprotei archaeon]|nr:hypothetical protein [Thermoprotei archaeon]